MNDLYIEKTNNTPLIKFVASTGIFTIEGRSIPEDPTAFYSKLYSCLVEYYKSPQPITEFHFIMEYINSGSSKALLDIFRYIKEQYDLGHQCIIYWYSEEDDESILELGQHYQFTFKLPFEFKNC
jgi:hypothetical protein